MNYNIGDLEKKILQCKNKGFEEIKTKDIDKIEDIRIDESKKGNERILDFLNKCKNPYTFIVNGTIVRIQFSDNSSITAEQCISRVLKNEYMK